MSKAEHGMLHALFLGSLDHPQPLLLCTYIELGICISKHVRFVLFCGVLLSPCFYLFYFFSFFLKLLWTLLMEPLHTLHDCIQILAKGFIGNCCLNSQQHHKLYCQFSLRKIVTKWVTSLKKRKGNWTLRQMLHKWIKLFESPMPRGWKQSGNHDPQPMKEKGHEEPLYQSA